MMKKKLASYYDFRRYFFPLGEVDGSFSKLLTTANNFFVWLFLANKPLGIVHWHAEIRRKLQILYTECSKKLTQIVTFSAPNVLNPLPSLNMHLIIKNALLWDQKFLNWRDLSIFKNAILVLSSTTVHCPLSTSKSSPLVIFLFFSFSE